ncbi:hypothetical protein SISNIDRAFT_470869 [Sistotremastrum niveocremeum HHB9708]|uniref:F-box domain-containing protein n=1 Tax=Sistotremastrum niveocremeum HHB9708 TaxID=1314777 RepID=A0A164NA61_9AGAM|nr:hypothetical protein SISNIDRAFT_470869 [Sistotremastrum niveocremeum HHB9708]
MISLTTRPSDNTIRTKLSSSLDPARAEPSTSSVITRINGDDLDLQSEGSSDGSKPSPRLPWELFTNILEGLVTPFGAGQRLDPALFVLARTCQALQVEAERVIYRNVVFQSMTEEAYSLNQMLHSRAAEYVETLSITDFGLHKRGMSLTDDRVPSSFSFNLPFHRMTRLRSLTALFLDLYQDDEREETRFFRQLDQALIPDVLHQFWTLTVTDPQDLQFIRRQNQLRRLTINKIPDQYLPDPSLLPKLEDLELSRKEFDQSLQLLQTRALRAVSLTFQYAHLNLNFDGKSLTFLEMKFDSVTPSDWILLLNLRAIDCPNIICLVLELDTGVGEEPLPLVDGYENEDWYSPVIKALEPWGQMQGLHLKAVTKTPSEYLISEFKTTYRVPYLRNVLLQVSNEIGPDEIYELCRISDHSWEVVKLERSDIFSWMDSWRSFAMKAPLVLRD